MKDPYSILGVSPNASEEEIKKAYKKLALEWHPDRHQGDKVAEDRFKEISEAFNLIKSGKYNNSKMPGFDTFSGFGFGDMFSQIFNNGFNPFSRTQHKIKTASIQITMEEAHNGCQKKIILSEFNVCNECRGTGVELTNETCKTCGGYGQIGTAIGAGNIHIARPCHVCKGYGKMPGNTCKSCLATGKKEIKQEIFITIPVGLLHGQKIYPQSNLEITVLYKNHPNFKLLDNTTGQIGSDITINMFDALLGNSIDIETLDGKKKLLINPGTQPGSILRIKNGGIGNNADHIVMINVNLPKDLNEKQVELLEQLKETMR